MIDLTLSRKMAEKIRFSGEKKDRNNVIYNKQLSTRYKDDLYIHGLEISEALTPSLESLFNKVCENILLPRKSISAFVYKSLDYQATCLVVNNRQCVLKISSSLVKDMEDNELSFIIGHEIGHFLLTHGEIENTSNLHNINRYKRAQEVSVDRIGLISCGNIDIAAQAIIKTISGLNKKYIRFDVNQYLEQLSKVDKLEKSDLYMSTHPTMIVRLRSLLWFNMNLDIKEYEKGYEKEVIKKIDKKVQTDLNEFIEKPLIEEKEKLNKELSLWLDLKDIFNEGKFSKHKQEVFTKKYGEIKLNKTLSFLSNNNKIIIKKHINDKIITFKNKLSLY